MTPNIEDALSYLPNHLVRLCCWISFNPNIDVKKKLLDLAHEGKTEQTRRSARLVLAKLDWAEMNLGPSDYAIHTYKTPVEEIGEDAAWYENMGTCPRDLLYQICISFKSELDYQLYCVGIDEIY